MTALELLTVVVAVLALAAAAAFALLAARAAQLVRALEVAAAEFEAVAVPAAEELRAAAGRATQQVDRVEDLVDLAASIGERVDTATEATYRALTSPVIKGAALATGTRRAARRLRERR
jgi:hypothetical protein